jgi:hypothetical protein
VWCAAVTKVAACFPSPLLTKSLAQGVESFFDLVCIFYGIFVKLEIPFLNIKARKILTSQKRSSLSTMSFSGEGCAKGSARSFWMPSSCERSLFGLVIE